MIGRPSLLALAAAACAAVAISGPARGEPFHGFYLRAEIGSQNLIAGSLVDGVDTLAQDSRTVTTLAGGLRGEFLGGWVVGVEVGSGRFDEGLRLVDTTRGLQIDYRGDSQFHYGLLAGHTVPWRRALVFAYAQEVTRDFEVSIVQNGVAFAQNDEQGLLRYGVGLEVPIAGRLHFSATAGSSRADFGDRPTNIDVEDELDAAFGLSLQF
jgi:hypothetical protein